MNNQFLFDTFVTAIEGGINYWAEVDIYHWNNDGADDLDNFHAYILDMEDEQPYKVDKNVIAKGIGIARKKNNCGGLYIDLAINEDDSGDIDAELADVIVQCGLFGDVVYA